MVWFVVFLIEQILSLEEKMSQKNTWSKRFVNVLVRVVFFGVICSVVIGVCHLEETSDASQEERVQRERCNRFAGSLLYFQDERTGLCFAYSYYGDRGGAMTVVPYEEVKHLLVNPIDDVDKSDPKNQ
jgi:hypothetical protein